MYYTPPPQPTSSYVQSVSQAEAVSVIPHYLAQSGVYNSDSDVYGSDVYGGDTYNGTKTSSNSELINTGTVVIGIITLAALLILAALVVRFWKKPGKKKDQKTK